MINWLVCSQKALNKGGGGGRGVGLGRKVFGAEFIPQMGPAVTAVM